uniref:Single domain-containing protein n=1 Tax=Hyalomma excavatum TaxID=257692 RepID=A0A131XA46_9ACAR
MDRNARFFLITAFFGIALWNSAEAYIGEAHVEVVDGKCVFENRTLGHHESLPFERPCQAWYCDTDAQKVNIEGCTPSPPLENCVEVRGNGTYPHCCPRLVCEGHDNE